MKATRRNCLSLSLLLLPPFAPAAQAQTPPALVGAWRAEDIRGGGVMDRLQSVLQLDADGTVSGSGGCNRMTGRAVIKDNAISFGQIASTKMACTPAAMNQERTFFDALAAVKFWRGDAQRRKLILLDAEKMALIVFARM
ncbi:MAG: META domain-containing protein [Beijerinckiaceae bacterium]